MRNEGRDRVGPRRSPANRSRHGGRARPCADASSSSCPGRSRRGPGYLPGQVNVGIFNSDQPLNYPFNANSAMCAIISFRALYVPAMLFPKVKWLGLPPVLLGITQALAQGTMSARIARDESRAKYSPGTLTTVLLHLPIGITYLRALARARTDRAQ